MGKSGGATTDKGDAFVKVVAGSPAKVSGRQVLLNLKGKRIGQSEIVERAFSAASKRTGAFESQHAKE